MSFKPLQDYILVERDEVETTSAGGIILKDHDTEEPKQGTVIAVGPGQRFTDGVVYPVEIPVGVTVLFGKFAGSDVKLEGKEYVILLEGEVLGVIL